jgi:hypothetical protein
MHFQVFATQVVEPSAINDQRESRMVGFGFLHPSNKDQMITGLMFRDKRAFQRGDRLGQERAFVFAFVVLCVPPFVLIRRSKSSAQIRAACTQDIDREAPRMSKGCQAIGIHS